MSAGNYDPEEFIDAAREKIGMMPRCRICGRNEFSTPEKVGYISIGDKTGPGFTQAIPCGVVTCSHCGHIELFSLIVMGIVEGGAK